MPQLSPRQRLVRDALFYTPFFLLWSALLVLMLVGTIDRAILGMIILVILVFLFGYQSIQTLRDLGSPPLAKEGAITRRWTKRDGFVIKSHYINVERTIYRIAVDDYLDLKTGDTVRVLAYPQTGTVVTVERLARPAPEEPATPIEPAAPSLGRMRTLRTARSTPSRRQAPPPHADRDDAGSRD